MQISRIEIKNFKGLKDVFLEPGNFTCLVGENNAGKSSVLQAINIALKLTPEVPEQLFYDSSVPVTFKIDLSEVSEADLNGLTEEQKAKILPYVLDRKLSLLLLYNAGSKIAVKIPTRVPKENKYKREFIDSVIKGKAAEYNQLARSSYPEWQTEMPTFKNQGEAKKFIEDKIVLLGADQVEEGLIELPTGIASSIKAILPEPIYIPAVKSFMDDLKVAQSTSFGRLISLLLDDLEPDLVDINKSLLELKSLFNRTEDGGQKQDNRHQKVKDLEKKVENHLKLQFPNVQIELEIPPPELKTILNSAKIFVNDGSRDLVDNKGDGIKRSLTFSLLRVYVEQLESIRAVNAEAGQVRHSPLFFLFEEPELYLHPRSQQILFAALGTISEQHMVMVTTHSPIFFAPGITASFIRVKKESAAPKPVGKLLPINFHLDPGKSESFTLAKFEKSEPAFFCSKVVLFEGDSDEFFLKHISKTLEASWDFDKESIGLVKVDGKGNFSKFREFFEAFGLKVFIIGDLDCLLSGFDKLRASDISVKNRDVLLQQIDKKTDALSKTEFVRSKKIREAIRKTTWQEKYLKARDALQKCIEEKKFDDGLAQNLDELFKIEQDDKRYHILKNDAETKKQLIPLLDGLRSDGIFILSRGPIEEYYPADTPGTESKPNRALMAIQKITSREHGTALSDPLSENRKTEFEEIFSNVFA